MSSSMVSVLINGSPTSEFIPKKGLRQGDPLAPLLSNVAVEAPSGLVREARRREAYKGFKVGDKMVVVVTPRFLQNK